MHRRMLFMCMVCLRYKLYCVPKRPVLSIVMPRKRYEVTRLTHMPSISSVSGRVPPMHIDAVLVADSVSPRASRKVAVVESAVLRALLIKMCCFRCDVTQRTTSSANIEMLTYEGSRG